ncbi:MAG: sodium:proline symporter [Haloarculaceae archaeon]
MLSTTLALAATAVTLAAFALFGVWYSRGRVGSVEDFISARDSAGQGTLTATLVASGMGAWILFSPAEAGVGLGITAAIGYGVGSAAPMLAYVFVGPRIRDLMPDGHTLTEYAHVRYGSVMYAYVLVVSVGYMFIFLAADLTAITNALQFVADVPRWQTGLLVTGFVLAYTAYGGLRASIVTDTAQALLIMPLLAVTFGGAVALLGGPAAVHGEIVAAKPALLDPGFVPGLKLGGALVLAILGAEMLNQAWWQRVYAGRDEATVRRSFAVTAVAVVPIVFVAGFAGTIAAGLGLVGDHAASNAFLLLLGAAFPPWIPFAVVLLVTLLVASTADTLFNALSSIVTADLPRLLDDPDDATLTLGARVLTVAAGVGAVVVAVWATSVLALFLLADLLAAATFVPLLYGLYSRRIDQWGAVSAAVAGLVAGLSFFPSARSALVALPGVGPLVGVLPAASLLGAFVLAVGVSAIVALVGARVTDARFDLGRLASDVHVFDDAEREVSD